MSTSRIQGAMPFVRSGLDPEPSAGMWGAYGSGSLLPQELAKVRMENEE